MGIRFSEFEQPARGLEAWIEADIRAKRSTPITDSLIRDGQPLLRLSRGNTPSSLDVAEGDQQLPVSTSRSRGGQTSNSGSSVMIWWTGARNSERPRSKERAESSGRGRWHTSSSAAFELTVTGMQHGLRLGQRCGPGIHEAASGLGGVWPAPPRCAVTRPARPPPRRGRR